MFELTALREHRAVKLIAVLVMAVLVSAYFPYLVPAIGVALLYLGISWYRMGGPARKGVGFTLAAGGAVLLAVSPVVYAGLVRQPGFEMVR
ncbi:MULTISPECIES: hypothetical protein [Halomicrobium]|uniref:Uncharacterized protein n=2 Tax=Halomicrobium mukohataei TaxID=57705 RepID=C7P041_HALMD|nr:MULTISPECIES: hypothetical protein [Halomicrobium]ACV46949.1 hypothetical protein Hmuk_0818 [Halomicrobium mukohataei DSM 12286]QCD65444.1 hypothetical protein E5139_07255 [Halomicrobium mukohataei]QFR20250.1 hypothetical protein GBQ70_07250 [Halomicrobium sp. ZPS1]